MGAVGEQEKMAAQWVEAQLVANQTVEALEAFPHIDGFEAEVDLCCWTESEHTLCSFGYAQELSESGFGEGPTGFNATAIGEYHDDGAWSGQGLWGDGDGDKLPGLCFCLAAMSEAVIIEGCYGDAGLLAVLVAGEAAGVETGGYLGE